MSTKSIFWMQENLPYPPQKTKNMNVVHEPVNNGDYNDLPYNQAVSPCISTSFYRFVQSEDGDSVFMNTHQPDTRINDFFGIKEN